MPSQDHFGSSDTLVHDVFSKERINFATTIQPRSSVGTEQVDELAEETYISDNLALHKDELVLRCYVSKRIV